MTEFQIYLTVGVFAGVILLIAFDVLDMALAALLFQDGRRADASAVTDAMLESTNGVDPWRGYADADDRFWPELIGRVRAEIHP
jgi:hypothetical protein